MTAPRPTCPQPTLCATLAPMAAPDDNAAPIGDAQDDAPHTHGPLPQQEAVFRPAVRFGHEPVVRTPLGWDSKNVDFLNHYPFISLPTQIAERVGFGAPELEPNRLIWGDCLHVMRQIPNDSVDLIYIDPPFFSNRVYNVIWGDNNELRSFEDIWKDGLDGYLIWLNARLYEMKRLLKPAGSIYVHCDWHASHYIKAEMDQLFGYGNFRNEIVWYYEGPQRPSQRDFADKHDVILRYSKSDKYAANTKGRFVISKNDLQRQYKQTKSGKWYYDLPKGDYSAESIERLDAEGRIRWTKNGKPRVMYFLEQNEIGEIIREKTMHDVWVDIVSIGAKGGSLENIGYPTQKPETLLERIINASSTEGDVVADFFIGGGTTAAVAQRLGRQFIACDQSRVAIAVTAERLKQAAQGRLNEAQYPDFTIEQWGIYEAERLAEATPEEFRRFVLDCYHARIPSGDEGIHGYKGAQARVPVWVGQPSLAATVTVSDVNTFAQAIARLPRYYGDEGLRDGVMLAWGFAPDAVNAAEELRGRGEASLAFVRLEQVTIESPAFRKHIASQSTARGDYSNFLTFVQPPEVSFAHRRLEPLRYAFDASDTRAYNPDAQIINMQWDFAYDGRAFRAERRPWADRAKLATQHKFPRAGTYTVACKAQDDKGGEGMRIAKVKVE